MTKLFDHTFTPFKRGQKTSPQNWGKPMAWNRRAVGRERIGVNVPKVVGVNDWMDFEDLMGATPQLDWVLTFKDLDHFGLNGVKDAAARFPNAWLLLDWDKSGMDYEQLERLKSLGAIVAGVIVDPFVTSAQVEILDAYYDHFDWLILRGDCRENEPRPLWTSWLTPIIEAQERGRVNVWLDAFGREFATRHGLGNPIGADPAEWPDYYRALRRLPTPRPGAGEVIPQKGEAKYMQMSFAMMAKPSQGGE